MNADAAEDTHKASRAPAKRLGDDGVLNAATVVWDSMTPCVSDGRRVTRLRGDTRRTGGAVPEPSTGANTPREEL
jgi:hypothetical protein